MIIIKNGLVVTDTAAQRDLAIENGKILRIDPSIEISEGDQVVDAAGCYVFPGFIDPHTHLQMDNGQIVTADSFETGTKAAVIGGTTTLIDFATQNKGGSLKDAYETWLAMAKDHSSCHYRFHMAITDYTDDIEAEIATMADLGITSFKIYLAYDALRIEDAHVYRCLKAVKACGGLLGAHCENGDLVNEGIKEQLAVGHMSPSAHPLSRPPVCEAESIARLSRIGELVDYPVHVVHLSSEAGLLAVREARARGAKVTVETCPQYLVLDDTKYALPGFEGAKFVMSPPLRKPSDQQALLAAILNGEIQTIATDHCSYDYGTQKILGKDNFSKIPNGAPGLEHRGVLMYTLLLASGKLTPAEFVALMSTNAAKLYQLYPQKGVIQAGSDADLVIYDPKGEYEIKAVDQYQNLDYTPYEGMKVIGRVRDVFLNGHHVVAAGQLVKPGMGSYAK